MSGVGNIYADEALWRAKIHPEIICEDLSEIEIRKVITSAVSVMKSAIKAGGTSFDEQYKNVNGESGYFSRSLKVYGREGEPCLRCGSAIRRIAFANRVIYVFKEHESERVQVFCLVDNS
jgi:formamidopyrimidine-DNA glycosylase